jgi:hypothetical protein
MVAHGGRSQISAPGAGPLACSNLPIPLPPLKVPLREAETSANTVRGEPQGAPLAAQSLRVQTEQRRDFHSRQVSTRGHATGDPATQRPDASRSRVRASSADRSWRAAA